MDKGNQQLTVSACPRRVPLLPQSLQLLLAGRAVALIADKLDASDVEQAVGDEFKADFKRAVVRQIPKTAHQLSFGCPLTGGPFVLRPGRTRSTG